MRLIQSHIRVLPHPLSLYKSQYSIAVPGRHRGRPLEYRFKKKKTETYNQRSADTGLCLSSHVVGLRRSAMEHARRRTVFNTKGSTFMQREVVILI